MTKVSVEVDYQAVLNESGRPVPGVVVTCSRCNHYVECFGQSESSVKRGCVLLKEECPRKERNFYDADGADDGDSVPSTYTGSALPQSIQTPAPVVPPNIIVPPGTPRLIAENKIAVVKTATTGLKRDKDQVVQVGIVQVDYGAPTWRSFVNIKPTVEIGAKASEKHGLTIEKLAFSPTFDRVANSIVAKLENRLIVGFNHLAFDLPILKRQFEEAGLRDLREFAALDTLLFERRFAQDELGAERQKHTLDEAAKRWGVPLTRDYDVMTDLKIIWALFVTFCYRFPELGQSDAASAIKLQSAEKTLHGLGLRTARPR